MLIQTLQGDCREILKSLPDNSVNCCVTSPPYFGLRDYGAAGQIGLEETPAEYVAALVEVFREVKRVLRPDGNCWLNLGDSYLNKQLLGIPWRVAFALQDIGFYLRSEVIWFKTNSMPESVNDRPTRCHEQIFLFTKSQNYFYDIDARAGY
jgi:DNA modification methylase